MVKKIIIPLLKGIFKPAYLIIAFILRRWKYSITFIIIAISLGASIVQSIEQKNSLPFITELGGRTLSLDYKLGQEADKITENGGIQINTETDKNLEKIPKLLWEFLKTYSSLLATIWIAIFLIKVVYKGLVKLDDSVKYFWLTISITLIYFIGSVYTVIIYATDDKPQDMKDIAKAFSLQGTRKFIKATPLLIKPAYEIIKQQEGDKIWEQKNTTQA